jgi:tetratricopeptide (TPR) repeat protein
MIVRDGEAHLPSCLASVRPFVQEIVIADTGSTDRSIEIARSFGARVIEVPWEDDFSKARNASLAEVRSDWVLSLDADERLDPSEALRLPVLTSGEPAGYLVGIRNYVLSANERIWDKPATLNDGVFPESARYPAWVEHLNVRLFRRDPEIYFLHRLHESVGGRILGTGRKLGEAGMLIHHFGLALAGEERARKNALYRRMGQAKIRDNPRDGQAHFELGLEEFEHFGDAAAALKCFEEATQLNPRLQVAWLFKGLAALKLGQDAYALEALRQARRDGRDTAMIAESEGDAHYNLGNCGAARRAYLRALLQNAAPASTATLESKLGLTAVRAGRADEGIDLLLRALERQPNCGHLYDRLVAATVSLNRLDDAAQAAECKLVNAEPDPDSFLRAAVLQSRRGDRVRAKELLVAGAFRFPDASNIRHCLAELQN